MLCLCVKNEYDQETLQSHRVVYPLLSTGSTQEDINLFHHDNKILDCYIKHKKKHKVYLYSEFLKKYKWFFIVRTYKI